MKKVKDWDAVQPIVGNSLAEFTGNPDDTEFVIAQYWKRDTHIDFAIVSERGGKSYFRFKNPNFNPSQK